MKPHHPIIVEILNDLTPRAGGSVLSPEDAQKWREALATHPHKHALATELIGLVKYFDAQRCHATAVDLLMLAAAAITAAAGEDPLRDPAEEASRLMVAAAARPAQTGGLRAPGLAPSVALRRRR